MRFNLSSIFLTVFIAFSCETTECCLPIDLEYIYGEYIVYEYGFSPGDRYIVEEVPDDPAQLLNFDPYGGFASNYQGLTEFLYYHVYDHPTEGKILGLFKDPPPSPDQVDLAFLEHSYIINLEGENLKLFFRYCIEGCHIGLRKIK